MSPLKLKCLVAIIMTCFRQFRWVSVGFGGFRPVSVGFVKKKHRFFSYCDLSNAPAQGAFSGNVLLSRVIALTL